MNGKKPDRKKLSRRDLFRVTGAAGAGLALGASGNAALSSAAGARDGAEARQDSGPWLFTARTRPA